MKTARFDSSVYEIANSTILRLPEVVSKQLPSRGQVSVKGTINEYAFFAVLEPDGSWGHWMHISPEMQNAAGVSAGSMARVEIETTKDWPEPVVPIDFADALNVAQEKVKTKWKDITPMARWEWVRWVNETKNQETRIIRIEKSIAKLNGNHRRPCCFNLASCTDPELSRGGRLVDLK